MIAIRMISVIESFGPSLEPHQRYHVLSLSKTLCPMLSTGSTQEMSQHECKTVDLEVKHQHNQNKMIAAGSVQSK